MLTQLSIRYKISLIALIGFLGFVVFQGANYRLSINIRDQLQNMLTEDFSRAYHAFVAKSKPRFEGN